MCGETNLPFRMLALVKIEVKYVIVDPLPLVPAIWMDLNPCKCGLFKWPKSLATRDSPKSIGIVVQ